MIRNILIILSCLVSVFFVWNYAIQDSRTIYDKGNSKYLSSLVIKGDISSYILANATLEPIERVDIGAQVNGQITKIHVSEGQNVSSGQLLVEIDPKLQENEVDIVESRYKSSLAQRKITKIKFDQLKIELNRQENLFKEGAGVFRELEQVRSDYHQTMSQLEIDNLTISQIKGELESAKAQLSYTKIRAPIDGKVLGLLMNEGQTIVSSQSSPLIMVLANTDIMKANVAISEFDMSKVEIGKQVLLINQDITTTLSSIRIAPDDYISASKSQQTANFGKVIFYNASFSIPNKRNELFTSMTLPVKIVNDQVENVLIVPKESIHIGKQGDYFVEVLSNGIPIKKNVVMGLSDLENVEIISGLELGDEVIVSKVNG
ncbi:efflux RND transporter periplasmic adaptor subunit [Shewanella japonica]|uniref:efflux RND transporter periplasmic adaptor subunit n=1 Tax=Shewanella japonica TaxID=93973 RepID=UPI002493E8B5|nr:efflux RND transporter periplasmic adaptor subunit [Shewanella japonica]